MGMAHAVKECLAGLQSCMTDYSVSLNAKVILGYFGDVTEVSGLSQAFVDPQCTKLCASMRMH